MLCREIAYWDDETTIARQLFQQRRGWKRRSGRYHNGVERRTRGMTQSTVTVYERYVCDAKPSESVGRFG
jgi:hypothetical protein